MDEAIAAESPTPAAESLQRIAGAPASVRTSATVHQPATTTLNEEGRNHEGGGGGGGFLVAKKQGKPARDCGSCGWGHPRPVCRFREAACRQCGKKGHLYRVCKASFPVNAAQQQQQQQQFQTHEGPNTFCVNRLESIVKH